MQLQNLSPRRPSSKSYRNAITTAKDVKTAGKILLDTLAKIEKALV